MANEAFETRPTNRPSRRYSRSSLLNSNSDLNVNETIKNSNDEDARKENDRLYRKLAAAAAASNSNSHSDSNENRPMVPRPPAHTKPDSMRHPRRSRFSFKEPGASQQQPDPLTTTTYSESSSSSSNTNNVDFGRQRTDSKSRAKNVDQSDIIDLLHKTSTKYSNSLSNFKYFL